MKKIFTATVLFMLVFSIFSATAFASEADVSTGEGRNAFESLYYELCEHSDKIFSALAFVGSLLLIFTYRRGMLPILKGGISTLSASVTNLKEEAKKSGKLSESEIKNATEKLEKAENLLNVLTERLTRLDEELEGAKERDKQNEDLKIIMKHQIDMLYEIFMSSSLPVYQKEAVGEKISIMKEQLKEKTEDGEGE